MSFSPAQNRSVLHHKQDQDPLQPSGSAEGTMLEVDPSIHSLLAFLQHASDPGPLGIEAPAAGIYWPESSHHQRLPHTSSQIDDPRDDGPQYYSSWDPHGIPTPQSADEPAESESAGSLAFADREFSDDPIPSPPPPQILPFLPERRIITNYNQKPQWALGPRTASVPTAAVAVAAEAASKRKAHRVSEKARRDRLTGAIRDLEALLTVGYSPGQDEVLDAAGQLNALSSKADVVELAIRYIKLLREERGAAGAGGAKARRRGKERRLFDEPEPLQLDTQEEASADAEPPLSPSMREETG
ncbi:hypothetical protein MAPG_01631 [Magnaporthiopsis poae ATCC 64411]|uniref:BHLH domain-containing protein n=1 Tax=Magnaporthiopsis poae (strain ATCC 64411 / 73-15) TaxID=644358 RepID=A0A0C4DP77_MAGP6|nr:hypothetical protein MAPG_01631 [Magnaporthiopsis poae ATCC 64411]